MTKELNISKKNMKKPQKPRSKAFSPLRHHARMTMVPHKKNQYRPHLIRWQGLAVVAILVVGLQLGYNYFHSGEVLGRDTSISQQQLSSETNAQRTAHGLKPVRESIKLDQAAQLKAQDMFKNQYWAHVSPSGVQPWHWIDVAGYQYSAAGENLAKGFSTSSGTMTAWMNSPEHRANILNPSYTDVGFAVMTGQLGGDETTLVVALYGAPIKPGVLAGSLQPTVLGASDPQLSLIARIGVGVQSMTPALVGSIILIITVVGVALLAHSYRNKLPKAWRMGWYRHHGLYKAVGMMSFVFILITLYGGGQV